MLLVLSLVHSADAMIYLGNPALGFRVDRPAGDYVDGGVVLDKVRVPPCGGGSTDVEIDQTIDPVAVTWVDIPAGDHCAVTWYWATDLDVNGPSYTVRYEGATTSVLLDEEIPPVALTPYSVVSGSMSGGGPWLMSVIE